MASPIDRAESKVWFYRTMAAKHPDELRVKYRLLKCICELRKSTSMQQKATVQALRKLEQSNSMLLVELNKATIALQNSKMQTSDPLVQQHNTHEERPTIDAKMKEMLRKFESNAKSKFPSLQHTQGNQRYNTTYLQAEADQLQPLKANVTSVEDNENIKPENRITGAQPGESYPCQETVI